MSVSAKEKITGSLIHAEKHLENLTEEFDSMLDLNRPRQCLLNMHSEQINFMEYNTQQGATADYMLQLNTSLIQAMQDPNCAYTVTDASLPQP